MRLGADTSHPAVLRFPLEGMDGSPSLIEALGSPYWRWYMVVAFLRVDLAKNRASPGLLRATLFDVEYGKGLGRKATPASEFESGDEPGNVVVRVA